MQHLDAHLDTWEPLGIPSETHGTFFHAVSFINRSALPARVADKNTNCLVLTSWFYITGRRGGIDGTFYSPRYPYPPFWNGELPVLYFETFRDQIVELALVEIA